LKLFFRGLISKKNCLILNEETSNPKDDQCCDEVTLREIGNTQLQVLKQELRLRGKNHFNDRLPYDIDNGNSEIDHVFTNNHIQMNSDEGSQEIIIFVKMMMRACRCLMSTHQEMG